MVRFFLVRINSSVSCILSIYDHKKCTDDSIGYLVILIHHDASYQIYLKIMCLA